MADLKQVFSMEVERRKGVNASIVAAAASIAAAIAQFTELNDAYTDSLTTSRNKLLALYKERRHYNGLDPAVYSIDASGVDTYPYFGETDAICNPYFPKSKVIDGTFDGLEPLEAPVGRSGAWARNQTYSPTEDAARGTALTQLNAYPDTSNEPTEEACTGETPEGSGTTEATCIANGGTWGYPSSGPSAPAILTAALNPWKTDIQSILADVDSSQDQTYNNPVLGSSRTATQWWQDVIDEIDTCLGLLPGDPTPPDQTPAPTGALLTSINNLITYADTAIATFVTARSSDLGGPADTEEQTFFGVVKLRLHQVNGSLSKLNGIKAQDGQNDSIIADNEAAIKDLNNLIESL